MPSETVSAMSRQDDKSRFVGAALRLTPPLLRESLLSDAKFRNESKFPLDYEIELHRGLSVTVRRSELFAAMRRVLSGDGILEVPDTDGLRWRLELDDQAPDCPSVFLCHEERRFALPQCGTLSDTRDVRLRTLELAISEVGLPAGEFQAWRRILSVRGLDDEEFYSYCVDIQDSPMATARSVLDSLRSGKVALSNLIPESRRYYERLVGKYDGSASLREYSLGGGGTAISELLSWRSYEGVLMGLLLSSHPSLVDRLHLDCLNDDEIEAVFDYVEKSGDRVSQIGAIELGVRLVDSTPSIVSPLISLIRQIDEENPSADDSRFRILLALYMMTDSELGQRHLFRDAPPFYRRLASMSHSALIHRQLVASSSDNADLCKWILENHARSFVSRSLVDMRVEPCWDPYMGATPEQFRNDYMGRIANAICEHGSDWTSTELSEVVHRIETKVESTWFLPGPLDAPETTRTAAPPRFQEMINRDLVLDDVGPRSFLALVTFGLVFRLDGEQSELAARALKICRHRLSGLEDRSHLYGLLRGLAMVSAATRSTKLAAEVRGMVRKYRSDEEGRLSVREALEVGLMACASESRFSEWCVTVGDWLSELAFGDLQEDEGSILFSYLRGLCDVVPELWALCGRAEAAVVAYMDR